MSTAQVFGVSRAPETVFADALRAAIATRGLPLDRIRAHLSQRGHPLSSATLSNWQHGRSHPYRGKALAAIGSLELVLGVPRGSLADLVPARTPAEPREGDARGPDDRNRPADARCRGGVVGGLNGTAPQLSASAQMSAPDVGDVFGIGWGEGYDRISTHDHITLDATGGVGSHIVRTVVRSTVDRLDRLLIGYQNDECGGVVDVVALSGCSLGATHELPLRRTQVAELHLARGVGRGETALFEYVVNVRDPVSRSRSALREVPTTGRETVMEIRCHPEALPAHLWQVRSCDGIERQTPMAMGRHGTVTLHESGFGPGQIGVRWLWPGDPGLPSPN